MGTDGHTAWHWHACPQSFNCLAGGPIRFTIPTSSLQKWDAFGEHFEIVEARDIRMFGHHISATFIKATQSAGKTLYIYSKQRGLLGFGAMGVADAPFFWLEEQCGFAAHDCH
jgi:hypothetical protein